MPVPVAFEFSPSQIGDDIVRFLQQPSSFAEGSDLGRLGLGEILRYPSNVESVENMRFITFRAFTPVYSNAGFRLRDQEEQRQRSDGASVVALYLPSYTITDSFDYDVGSEGMVGAALERLRGLSPNTAIDEEEIMGTLGLALKIVIKEGAQRFAKSFAGNASSQLTRGLRVVPNPRNFSTFSGPTFRQFSFDFEFVPSNERESYDVMDIIQYFRFHSYPGYKPGTVHYDFPEYFKISISPPPNNAVNDKPRHDLIRVPECVCDSVNVTYNPNEASFFRLNNFPTQINLSLSFSELEVNTREGVERGF